MKTETAQEGNKRRREEGRGKESRGKERRGEERKGIERMQKVWKGNENMAK